MIGMADYAAAALPAGMIGELNMSETIHPGTNLRMAFDVPPHREKKRTWLTSKKPQRPSRQDSAFFFQPPLS